METGEIHDTLICSDTDFQIAMEIAKILLQHAAYVFRQLPQATAATQTANPKINLFQALPPQFDCSKYIEIAAQLQIPESTANKWLTKFVSSNLLIKQAHGSYTKSQ